MSNVVLAVTVGAQLQEQKQIQEQEPAAVGPLRALSGLVLGPLSLSPISALPKAFRGASSLRPPEQLREGVVPMRPPKPFRGASSSCAPLSRFGERRPPAPTFRVLYGLGLGWG